MLGVALGVAELDDRIGRLTLTLTRGVSLDEGVALVVAGAGLELLDSGQT